MKTHGKLATDSSEGLFFALPNVNHGNVGASYFEGPKPRHDKQIQD